jgi:hypothetical protein
VHFILIKPVLSDHMPYVTIFHHYLARFDYIEKPGKLLTGSMKFFQLQYFMLSPPTAIG